MVNLECLLTKLYNKETVTTDELYEFIEFMYKKLNPNKPYNPSAVDKLFAIDQLLQTVLHYYLSVIEDDPFEFGLSYLKIYNGNTLIKVTVTKV